VHISKKWREQYSQVEREKREREEREERDLNHSQKRKGEQQNSKRKGEQQNKETIRVPTTTKK